MHAKEVENERGDDQQWRNTLLVACLLVPVAQSGNHFGRFPGRSRDETDPPLTVRENLDGLVVPLLPFARITGMPSLSKRMKPADDVRGDLNTTS